MYSYRRVSPNPVLTLGFWSFRQKASYSAEESPGTRHLAVFGREKAAVAVVRR